jgi:membrane protease YdiL (CAAX protease family)
MQPYQDPAQPGLRADGAAEQTIEPVQPPGAESEGLRFAVAEPERLHWVFFNSEGLRGGWSVVIFAFLLFLLAPIFGTILSILVFNVAHLSVDPGSPLSTIFGEGQWLSALTVAAILVALIDQRKVTDYNLGGAHGLRLFAGGVVAGFVALSTLIGILMRGGWLQIGPVALSGADIFKYALLWGVAFVMVALFEEGAFRGFLQSTFARSINFWWALATVASLCLYLLLSSSGRGAWGIYIIALLGLLPCVWFHVNETPDTRFWQAAWATSTAFGFIHTFNSGENWVGILGAATIGFVFCVSVRVTGSAWWAVGCHASWDWAESYFYGTADSGFAAKGHYLSTTPVGSALWSGGADGPEGSLLILPIVLLLLVAVCMLYGRRAPVSINGTAKEPLAS